MMTIGYGVRQGKLYYLNLELKSTIRLNQALQIGVALGNKVEDEISLWHHRLGHMSLRYLNKFS